MPKRSEVEVESIDGEAEATLSPSSVDKAAVLSDASHKEGLARSDVLGDVGTAVAAACGAACLIKLVACAVPEPESAFNLCGSHRCPVYGTRVRVG